MNASIGADEPLDAAERAELQRLRQELAELRGARAEESANAAPVDGTRSAGHRALRWTGAAVLLVLVAVLSFSAVLARYAHNEVLDTDRYVRTMSSLGSDPVLQAELTDQITDEIVTRLDVEAVTADALRSIADDAARVPPAVVGLAPVIADQAESFVHRTVESVVASDQFEALWIQANEQAHSRAAGNMWPDSMKAGAPVIRLSVTPITVVRPATVTVSTLNSGPSTHSSSRMRGERCCPLALIGNPAMASTATRNSASSPTRRTNIPPHRSTGFTTSG